MVFHFFISFTFLLLTPSCLVCTIHEDALAPVHRTEFPWVVGPVRCCSGKPHYQLLTYHHLPSSPGAYSSSSSSFINHPLSIPKHERVKETRHPDPGQKKKLIYTQKPIMPGDDMASRGIASCIFPSLKSPR